MLLGDDVAGLWFEASSELAAPRAVFKRLTLSGSLLNWHNVCPGVVVARTVTTMHRVEDMDACSSGGIEHLLHVGNTIVRFGDRLDAIPDLAALGNEIVVRIDDDHCSDLFVKLQIFQVLNSYAKASSLDKTVGRYSATVG